MIEIFDPCITKYSLISSLLIRFIIAFFLFNLIWAENNNFSIRLVIITGEVKQIFSSIKKESFVLNVIIMPFFIIIFINMTGIINYTYTLTAHPSSSLLLAALLFMPSIINTFFFNFKKSVTHLTPEGAPNALIPLLVPIEIISLLIRPVTLGLRLIANIMAGHIIISLIRTFNLRFINKFRSLLFNPQIILILLETAVALIQAYVFTLLIVLYLKESSS